MKVIEFDPEGKLINPETPADHCNVKRANRCDPDKGFGVSLNDFHAYMPTHAYIFAPSGELWPASSINERIAPVPLFDDKGEPVPDKDGNQKKMRASNWLDRNRPVEQMTWAPGLPMLIRDRLISDGGWGERGGVTCFNLYRPPVRKPGNAAKAGPGSNTPAEFSVMTAGM